MNEVKEGEVYRHFKGTFFYIICVAQDSETCERIVVYRHLDNTKGIWWFIKSKNTNNTTTNLLWTWNKQHSCNKYFRKGNWLHRWRLK